MTASLLEHDKRLTAVATRTAAASLLFAISIGLEFILNVASMTDSIMPCHAPQKSFVSQDLLIAPNCAQSCLLQYQREAA